MTTRRALMWLMVSLCLVGAFLLWLMPRAAHAQSMGVLSTPMTVATVGMTNVSSGNTDLLVAAQGSGIKIRVLGFFLTSQRYVQVQFIDKAGTACTGVLTIATGGTLSVPVMPPGYICETGADQSLHLRLIFTGLSTLSGTVGGGLQWQASQ